MNLINSFSNFRKNFSTSSGTIVLNLNAIKLGSDIDGIAADDLSGWSVSMNAAGDRVAIGSPYNNGDRGYARIFYWNGLDWTQLGENIIGEAAGDQSGYSVSMNAAGDIVAIGAIWNDGTVTNSNVGHVRVYYWDGSAWTKLGQDMDGEAIDDLSGFSVSISANGYTVAIGSTYNTSSRGHVRIYYLSGNTWIRKGFGDIDGETFGDASGWSVSMNDAGDRVAIGAIDNDGNGTSSGSVRVYSWNGSAWTKLGQDIDGETANDQSGYSVSMNAAGNRVAIGAIYNDGNGSSSGHVRIYYLDGETWRKLGEDIDGEASGDSSGFSVSMNSAGDRVAIGAVSNDGNGSGSGSVRVYYWNGLIWVKLNQDIDGESSGDLSGYSVSMNAVGDKVAIGAIYNDGSTPNSNVGHVRVYTLQ